MVKYCDEKGHSMLMQGYSKLLVVTIDGPAGSGKSTVSRLLSQKLGFAFLSTGAFYRGLAFLCREKKVDLTDKKNVATLAQDPDFRVVAEVAGTKVFIHNRDVTEELISEDIAALASKVSAIPEVRAALLERQRSFAKPPGLVAEGRDCGTVVFPNALVKIFLTATLDARAQRRSRDEKPGFEGNMKDVVSQRDSADTSRKTSPLAKAVDAIEIDSSSLSADEVVARIEAVVKERLKKV